MFQVGGKFIRIVPLFRNRHIELKHGLQPGEVQLDAEKLPGEETAGSRSIPSVGVLLP